jgi:hypothetical protein
MKPSGTKPDGEINWDIKERGRAKARRSHRLALQVPVLVYEAGRDQRFILDDAFASVVSKHGALLLLSTNVNSGQTLTITNKRTKESRECRVVFVGPHPSNKKRVGVEFLTPAPHFWGIFFPPIRNVVQRSSDPAPGRLAGDN